MHPNLENTIEYAAYVVRKDLGISTDKISDFRLKSIIRDVLVSHVETEIYAKHLADLTSLVLDLAKIRISE